jgi:hypothetical protein
MPKNEKKNARRGRPDKSNQRDSAHGNAARTPEERDSRDATKRSKESDRAQREPSKPPEISTQGHGESEED